MVSAGDRYRIQAQGCRHGESKSLFYAELFDALAVDADSGGPAARVLASCDDLPLEAVTPLRLLGGIHREVLAGALPELARRFPSTGGDGDAHTTLPALLAALAAPSAVVQEALTRDPQTNEVGRAAALAAGFCVVARDFDNPLRILEIGASGGLNLRLDRFWFDAGNGAVWGDPESAVRFERASYDGDAPFTPGAQIAERRGCDLHPIDASTDAGRLTLLGYVWPDQPERLARLRSALDIAAELPVTIDTAAADEWIDEHAHPRAGVTTVVFHSIMWQYLPNPLRRAIAGMLLERGATATADAPFAWLRFEPARDWSGAELRLQRWPGGTERLLATSSFHGPPVRFVAGE